MKSNRFLSHFACHYDLRCFLSQLDMNNSRVSYRQTRSLENIGENAPMDQWYQKTNHLIFINENNAMSLHDGSFNNNEIIER